MEGRPGKISSGKRLPGEVFAILDELKQEGDPDSLVHLREFGIDARNAFGVRIPVLRRIARRIKFDSKIANGLWDSEIHEARILATMVMDPEKFSTRQAQQWLKDLYSWDLCDQFCMNLLSETSYALSLARRLTSRREEFMKRAGFVIMAVLSVHDKSAADGIFLDFLPLIEKHSGDERNFVKKGVNWALRFIGKRNPALRKAAAELSKRLAKSENKTARWIGRDALKELLKRNKKTR